MNASLKQIFTLALGVLLGLFLGLIALGLLYVSLRPASGQKIPLLPSVTPQPIVIYITGAVVRPGVYSLPPGSRLLDAINAAGGLAENADLSSLNAAEALKDEQEINIPGSGEFTTPVFTLGGSGLVLTATPLPGGPVNINTADLAALDALPGIGPSTAQAILDYRAENGPFQSVEDLLKVPGIGSSTLENLRPLITVQ